MARVSVLIAHYDNDGSKQKYLDLCLESLEKQTFKDFEIITVSSGDSLARVEHNDRDRKHVRFSTRKHFPAAITEGYRYTDKNSEFLMLLNNDTSLDTHFLERALAWFSRVPDEIIVNGLCNSDAFGFLYYAVTGYYDSDGNAVQFEKPFYRYDELPVRYLTNLIKYLPGLIPIAFNPFYATVMKRSTYEKVGGIFEGYLTNLDDLDFSLRARKHGIKSMVATDAAVFHFGGVTSSETKTQSEENFNQELLRQRTERDFT